MNKKLPTKFGKDMRTRNPEVRAKRDPTLSRSRLVQDRENESRNEHSSSVRLSSPFKNERVPRQERSVKFVC